MRRSTRLSSLSPWIVSLVVAPGCGAEDDTTQPTTGWESLSGSGTGSAGETGGTAASETGGAESAGDGDTATGDGDGTSATGDGTSGDGDGTSGDGDGTTGDGDGTTSGDGDGTTGDGDGTTATGDGDGSSGDGDGTTTGDGDGTTATGDGDGTTGDGDGDGVMPCAIQPPTVDFEPPNIVFVLDKSGSMMSTINNVTFWEILHTTLQNVISSREDSIKFGIKWFGTDIDPMDITNQCRVEPGLEVEPPATVGPQWAAIDAVLPPANSQISSFCLTPGQDGYDRASEWVNANLVPTGETTAMVLFFDGALSDGRMGGPDCNDSADPTLAADAYVNANSVAGLTSSIAANNANGVNTYVIGFWTDPTIDPEMNGYAQAGGTSAPGANDFFLAQNSSALLQAFDSIATEVATCDISITIAPPNPDLTEVVVNGVTYAEITAADCATQNGWYWLDPPTYNNIRLCGTACDDFIADWTTTEVNFYCTAG